MTDAPLSSTLEAALAAFARRGRREAHEVLLFLAHRAGRDANALRSILARATADGLTDLGGAAVTVSATLRHVEAYLRDTLHPATR